MAAKYAVDWRGKEGDHGGTSLIDTDEELREFLGRLDDAFDWMQIRHLSCEHLWGDCDPRGMVDGRRYRSYRCQRCEVVLLNVMDHELTKIFKERR